jgi:hypothetical protein
LLAFVDSINLAFIILLGRFYTIFVSLPLLLFKLFPFSFQALLVVLKLLQILLLNSGVELHAGNGLIDGRNGVGSEQIGVA